jgi:hypothetical protein
MEVVLVGVGDEHGVDRGDLQVGRLAAAAHRADTPDQEWVEEELDVVEFEPDRRVPEPTQARHAPLA